MGCAQGYEEELSVLFASQVVQAWSDARDREAASSPSSSPNKPALALALHRTGASLGFLQATAESVLQISQIRQLGIQVKFCSAAFRYDLVY